ncbi:MAG: ABC transporter substrate-binding protein [Desulfotomaculales bacterium]
MAVFIFLLITAALTGAAGGCGHGPDEGRSGPGQVKIRLGMLPIIDNLPFWVAQEKGYFQDAGLDVELIPFPSAVERDSALTAGKIDGGVGDLLAVAALRNAGTQVKAVSLAMGARPGESRFAVLSSPDSGIRTVEQLKNVEIAVSLNSIIEYATDKLLQHQGLKAGEIKKVSIPKMPVRLEALLTGKVKAATLPDPLATLAVIRGAHIIADTMNDNVAQTVIIINEDLLAKNLPAAKKLMNAYARAVGDIRANPAAFAGTLAQKANVPEEVLTNKEHRLPVNFSAPRLPSRQDVQEVVDWLKARNLIEKPLQYEEMVDGRVIEGSGN